MQHSSRFLSAVNRLTMEWLYDLHINPVLISRSIRMAYYNHNVSACIEMSRHSRHINIIIMANKSLEFASHYIYRHLNTYTCGLLVIHRLLGTCLWTNKVISLTWRVQSRTFGLMAGGSRGSSHPDINGVCLCIAPDSVNIRRVQEKEMQPGAAMPYLCPARVKNSTYTPGIDWKQTRLFYGWWGIHRNVTYRWQFPTLSSFSPCPDMTYITVLPEPVRQDESRLQEPLIRFNTLIDIGLRRWIMSRAARGEG